LIGIGPVLPGLTDDLALSQTQASVLVALPTALMGAAAVPGGRVADRVGARLTLAIGLALVAVAGGGRAISPNYAILVLATTLFGIGIGLAQPALPRLARDLLPGRLGLATAIYAGGFFAGSTLSAFLTAPVLIPLGGDDRWRLPLAVWGLLGLAGLVCWLLWMARAGGTHAARRQVASQQEPDAPPIRWSPWRDRGTWLIAAIFAGQGLAYYLLVAWLPSVYDELGLSAETSAALFATYNLATFPAMVGLPVISDRLGNRRLPTAVASLLFTIGAVGLASAPQAADWRWIWPALAGLGVAGLFGMSLVLPLDVAPPHAVGAAAGMVLGIGYLGSALGPVIGGAVNDLTGSFSGAMTLLPIVGAVMFGLSLVIPTPRARSTL
jgi:CP family cyanate transporter-like MFS transporter